MIAYKTGVPRLGCATGRPFAYVVPPPGNCLAPPRSLWKASEKLPENFMEAFWKRQEASGSPNTKIDIVLRSAHCAI